MMLKATHDRAFHPTRTSDTTLPSSPPPPYLPDADTSTLPKYSNELSGAAHFLLKPELADPKSPWPHRRWCKVALCLQGTQVSIRQASGFLLCQRPLSLQGADAGLAPDYSKRPYVFRLRAEGFQFLLAAADGLSALNWVDKLNAAALVSLDLDEREEPRDNGMVPVRMQRPSQGPAPGPGLMSKWRHRVSDDDEGWLRTAEYCPGCSLPSADGICATFLPYMRSRHQAQPCQSSGCICSTCYCAPHRRPPYITALVLLPELPAQDIATQKPGACELTLPSSPRSSDGTDSACPRQRARTLTFNARWSGKKYVRDRQWIAIGRDGN
ncbi:hypothetical protein KC323_g833 [Hortaea werneckii]|nr:hypothetical protein KC323_g833 [Hortaea werneckii]KAI7359465.1 hypothetical protein KC320_g513 [Hortaea werneckii]